LQRGGPNGDFTVAIEGLADRWPDERHPLLWKRLSLPRTRSVLILQDLCPMTFAGFFVSQNRAQYTS
jgi:hypothetical protein